MTAILCNTFIDIKGVKNFFPINEISELIPFLHFELEDGYKGCGGQLRDIDITLEKSVLTIHVKGYYSSSSFDYIVVTNENKTKFRENYMASKFRDAPYELEEFMRKLYEKII